MKNFTLAVFAALLIGGSMNAQTYSTGNIFFFANYSGKIDVTSTTVTVTLIGPTTSWMGIGFNTTTMDSGSDAVIFDGTVVSDRNFVGLGNTPAVDTQNWTISSNTPNSPSVGLRTVLLTRSRVATQGTDFTFPFAAQPLSLVFARSVGSNVIEYHGAGNCGTTMTNLTLGTEDYVLSQFKMYPNPTNYYTTIELPNSINEVEVIMYDFLGRIVKKGYVTATENRFDTSNLQKGSYMIKVSTEEGTATKTLVVN